MLKVNLLAGALLALPALHGSTDGDVSGQALITIEAGDDDSLCVGELLEIAKDALGIDYFLGVDEDVLKHPLGVYGTPKIPALQFMSFFENTLRTAGVLHFELSEGGAPIHYVVFMDKLHRGSESFKALAPVVPIEQIRDLYGRNTLVTTTYFAKHVSARDLVNTLQPYFANNFTDSIRNLNGTNAILMTGFSNTVLGIHELLTELDTPPEKIVPVVTRRELKHADADAVFPLIQRLVDTHQRGVRKQVAAETGQTRAGTSPADLEPELAVMADRRTNSVVLAASEEGTAMMLSWIDKLDVEVASTGAEHDEG